MSETKTKEGLYSAGTGYRRTCRKRTAEPGNDFYHFNSGCYRDFRDLCSMWCICKL